LNTHGVVDNYSDSEADSSRIVEAQVAASHACGAPAHSQTAPACPRPYHTILNDNDLVTTPY